MQVAQVLLGEYQKGGAISKVDCFAISLLLLLLADLLPRQYHHGFALQRSSSVLHNFTYLFYTPAMVF